MSQPAKGKQELTLKDIAGFTWQEFSTLFEFRVDHEKRNKWILIAIATVFSPLVLAGALLGFVRSYERFLKPRNQNPKLYPLLPISRAAMAAGAILLPLCLVVFLFAMYSLLKTVTPDVFTLHGLVLPIYLITSFSSSLLVFRMFQNWQVGHLNAQVQGEKFGTARFAEEHELIGYNRFEKDGKGYYQQGIYLGGGYQNGYVMTEKGHILTVAGTRGGKGTSLIIPNLLDIKNYAGSWVVIDPKGENAAITAAYQFFAKKQNLVILNPWQLLPDILGEGNSYNPLDILDDTTNPNLVDDATVIAEMIVPINPGDRDKFFTDNARSIISGLLLYMAVELEQEKRTLKTLWEFVRLPKMEWLNLVAELIICDNEHFGETINQAGNEITKLMESGDKTWGTIIAVVLQCTDFIKSPALQKAMESGFDPYSLADGKTTLYVIIPADKLQSHARWLRLVVTTTMRAIVRRPNKKVCFLLDEFAALGYLPEIETALSTYAGFNITVWAILQSLIQLQTHYAKNWETFVGNSTIRQFFSVNDNFTADYVSKAIGSSSYVISKKRGMYIESSQSNKRELITPDELRRASGQNIFAFFGDKPVTYFPKQPYYDIPELVQNGQPRFDENPYFKQ